MADSQIKVLLKTVMNKALTLQKCSKTKCNCCVNTCKNINDTNLYEVCYGISPVDAELHNLQKAVFQTLALMHQVKLHFQKFAKKVYFFAKENCRVLCSFQKLDIVFVTHLFTNKRTEIKYFSRILGVEWLKTIR